ncbi:MAG: ABC transporter substrate-binding protein [Deltaproteobacteria bacterium]|nr:ABC transporter substrate-binding protein [Deltaproteobacteria bacterium]
MGNTKVWKSVVMALALLFVFTTVGWAEVGVSKKEIKIGGIVDLSGPIAFMGKGVSDGAKLYFKYINDKGGIYGRKITYILEDDGYQSPRSVQACKKLVTKDKVFCIFMVLGSAQCNAMYPFLESRGIPLLLPGTQNRDMGVPPRKYLFLADPHYTTQGKLAVEYIVEDMGIKDPKIACIYQDDTPGHDWRRGVRIGCKHYGLKPLELPYKRGSVDFSSQVAKCKDAGITHILMWTLVREPAIIMKEAQRLQYKATYTTSTASMVKKVIDLGGDAIDYTNGFYCTGMVYDAYTETTPRIIEFKENMAKYKMCDIDNFYNLYGYQAAVTLVEGLKRAGKKLTREGLIKALETFRNFDNGILSPITWGPNRRAGGSAVRMYKVKNGRWTPIGDWRFSKIKEE